MKLSKVVSLAFALSVTPVHAVETLRVGISQGFQPVLESLKPRLSQQLGMNIEISPRQNIDLYTEFNKKTVSSDLVIFIENPAYGTPKINQFLENNSQIIAASQVILWCPNNPLPKRVTLLDTLFQAKVSTIAVPPKSSRVGSIFLKNVPNIPANTRLVTAGDSLAAWRMARNKQVQCAVTLDKWLRPGDQFVYISNEEIILRGYINPARKNTVKARQVINLLSSPLIQPLMMRATSIELAQDIPKIRKLENPKRARVG
ncbi:hypothetical protein [Alkanindiges illinoisensis]|uniref:hypothetical protein n=1 Tax=Alkanindiges illinoisensis TaxID=197183 RepID=UPI00047E488A|nr:hypothetical protein [Alkanindiges illinoisensis]